MDQLTKARRTIDEMDRQMALLFCRRMAAVRQIAAWKQAQGLPILDAEREEAILSANINALPETTLRGYYAAFLRNLMEISRAYQADLISCSEEAEHDSQL